MEGFILVDNLSQPGFVYKLLMSWVKVLKTLKATVPIYIYIYIPVATHEPLFYKLTCECFALELKIKEKGFSESRSKVILNLNLNVIGLLIISNYIKS